MKTKKIMFLCLLLTFCLIAFSGCIPGDGKNNAENLAGFFWGIWHGWVAPISLVMSFFNDKRHIYEIFNKGFQYDLGFYMAVISGFGGLAIVRNKNKSDHH